MKPMPKQSEDRRYYERTEICSPVKYRLSEEDDYKEALLINISETGALIGVNEELGMDTHIYMKMESDEVNQQPIKILVDTVRNAETIEGYQYCYGCMILDVIDE